MKPLLLAAALALSPTLLRAQAPERLSEEAVRKVFPALVRIYVVSDESENGRIKRQRAAGSGVIISADGYLVTNHHVAGRANRLVVNLADQQEIDAELVGTDPLTDIAVLKLKLDQRRDPKAPLPVAVWGDSDQVKVGDVVFALGSPGALSQSVTQGIVANTRLILPKMMEGTLRMEGEDVGSLVRWIAHDAVIFGEKQERMFRVHGPPLVTRTGNVEQEVRRFGPGVPSAPPSPLDAPAAPGLLDLDRGGVGHLDLEPVLVFGQHAGDLDRAAGQLLLQIASALRPPSPACWSPPRTPPWNGGGS
ncbi:MAG: trypsin-like peptidase domain-containing protein [Kiritimatiellia bacterium]